MLSRKRVPVLSIAARRSPRALSAAALLTLLVAVVLFAGAPRPAPAAGSCSDPGPLEPRTPSAPWNGSWTTHYTINSGEDATPSNSQIAVRFYQSGSSVLGCFSGGTMNGSVGGSVLSGTFSDGSGPGSFEFVINHEQNQFEGTYSYDSGSIEDAGWIGFAHEEVQQPEPDPDPDPQPDPDPDPGEGGTEGPVAPTSAKTIKPRGKSTTLIGKVKGDESLEAGIVALQDQRRARVNKILTLCWVGGPGLASRISGFSFDGNDVFTAANRGDQDPCDYLAGFLAAKYGLREPEERPTKGKCPMARVTLEESDGVLRPVEKGLKPGLKVTCKQKPGSITVKGKALKKKPLRGPLELIMLSAASGDHPSTDPGYKVAVKQKGRPKKR